MLKEKPVLSLATYNIEGGRNIPEVIQTAVAENISILAVQETGPDRRIDELRRAMRALRLLYNRVAFAPGFDLHVATFTRDPITKTSLLPGFRNAGLITIIDNPDLGLIAICNAHLTPFTEKERLREIETALSQLRETDTNLRIITGDLNSLSSQDHYPSDLFISFNDVQRNKFMAGGSVQHRVIDRVLEEGYIDAAVHSKKENEPTVPTKANRDSAHGVPLRLDYVFVSQDLASHIKYYEVLKNDVTNVASDHYPVVVVFDRSEAGGT